MSSLVLTETSRTSGAWVTGLEFHLNTDNPAHGNRPVIPVRTRVEAGAAIELAGPPSPYFGEYQFTFGSAQQYETVSVVISYVDDAGRSGSLSAVATVSR